MNKKRYMLLLGNIEWKFERRINKSDNWTIQFTILFGCRLEFLKNCFQIKSFPSKKKLIYNSIDKDSLISFHFKIK